MTATKLDLGLLDESETQLQQRALVERRQEISREKGRLDRAYHRLTREDDQLKLQLELLRMIRIQEECE